MTLRILSGNGALQIMPFRKLGGKCHFFLRFCTRKRSKTYLKTGMLHKQKTISLKFETQKMTEMSTLSVLSIRACSHWTTMALLSWHFHSYPCHPFLTNSLSLSSHVDIHCPAVICNKPEVWSRMPSRELGANNFWDFRINCPCPLLNYFRHEQKLRKICWTYIFVEHLVYWYNSIIYTFLL